MVVLGIDPGTETTGYGVVAAGPRGIGAVAFGLIRTKRSLPRQDRLRVIHDEVGALVARHHPELAVVERLYFKKNVTSAMAVGEARGVVLLALASQGVPVLEATPPEVKAAVAGYGGATKPQVVRMVEMLLGVSCPADDAADALAAALFGLFAHREKEALDP